MQLRYKLAAIVSGMAMVAGPAVVFAGPASASDGVRLCISSGSTGGTTNCAINSGNGLTVTVSPESGTSGSAWNAPNGGTGEISVAGGGTPGSCMEVNASASNEIRTATCAGKASEKWNVTVGDTVFGGKTFTAYVYQSVYNTKLCLQGPATLSAKSVILYAKPCKFTSQTQNWMQCHGFCG